MFSNKSFIRHVSYSVQIRKKQKKKIRFFETAKVDDPLKGMCSSALNHLAKPRSLSFVFFCVRLRILVGSALTFKVNVEQVSKLITLSHDVRLGCLVSGRPFAFLFKMGEIQSHFALGNERDPRQYSETCRYFSLLKVVISRLSESYKSVKNILDLHRIFCVVKS